MRSQCSDPRRSKEEAAAVGLLSASEKFSNDGIGAPYKAALSPVNQR